jgi:hypothetical protein
VHRIRRTYAEGSLMTAGDAWQLEGEVAGEWQSAGLDPDAIEQRRQAVVARGRTQLG